MYYILALYSPSWFISTNSSFFLDPTTFALLHTGTQVCLVEISLPNNSQAHGSDFALEQRRFAGQFPEFPNSRISRGGPGEYE